jgi:hypothetical protein
LLGGGWVDGEFAIGFDVPGAGCFCAGFEVCAVGVVAGFIPTGAPVRFDAVALTGFAPSETGAEVDFTCPGISEDAVTG